MIRKLIRSTRILNKKTVYFHLYRIHKAYKANILNKKKACIKWRSSCKLTWARIMYLFPLRLHKMLADMTSILCFSSTKDMVVKRPCFLVAHMQNCASSPKMFNTTFGEAQVLKITGCRGADENEFAGFEAPPPPAAPAKLLEDP